MTLIVNIPAEFAPVAGLIIALAVAAVLAEILTAWRA